MHYGLYENGEFSLIKMQQQAMKSIGERKSPTLLGNPRCLISLLSKMLNVSGIIYGL